MTIVTANGNTYSDDGSTAKDMNEGGFRTFMMPMVSDVMHDVDIALVGSAANAVLAQAAAAAAILTPGTFGTSTTSLTTGYGSKSLTVQAGKEFRAGMFVQVASAAAPTTWTHGVLASYNSATGALVMTVDAVSTVGSTAADWIVTLSAPGGATLGFNQYTGSQFYAAGIFEGAVAMGAGTNVDTSAGTIFTKTATAGWALTVSGIPAGASASFILALTNGGAYSFTPPAGTTYATKVAPTLTAAGKDYLGFIKCAGEPWVMLMIGKDVG